MRMRDGSSDVRSSDLLVTKAGQRYWRMDYRFAEKRATAALGVYPTITLAEARAKRLEIKKKIAEGINPAAKRKIDKINGNHANDKGRGTGREGGEEAGERMCGRVKIKKKKKKK